MVSQLEKSGGMSFQYIDEWPQVMSATLPGNFEQLKAVKVGKLRTPSQGHRR
jgi:hypothetical protein